MACAANYAWANRQMLTHWTRETFEKVLHLSPRDLGMRLLYDVCHNIAKKEKFVVGGQEVELCVHRKGATRALPPGHPAVPQRYREVGQPVLIPGDMANGAYVLVGKEGALKETFGSACHGAGRVMSRSQAIKASKNRPIVREMAGRGVIVMAGVRKPSTKRYRRPTRGCPKWWKWYIRRAWPARWPACVRSAVSKGELN